MVVTIRSPTRAISVRNMATTRHSTRNRRSSPSAENRQFCQSGAPSSAHHHLKTITILSRESFPDVKVEQAKVEPPEIIQKSSSVDDRKDKRSVILAEIGEK